MNIIYIIIYTLKVCNGHMGHDDKQMDVNQHHHIMHVYTYINNYIYIIICTKRTFKNVSICIYIYVYIHIIDKYR